MGEDNLTFELKEPKTPEALLPHDYSLLAWLSPALLALLVLLVLLVRWRRRGTPQSPQARRHLAFKEAASALAQISAPQAHQAAVQASLILRKYLSLAADDPALFETHEEFVARHAALAILTEHARAACETGLRRLAALKYAPEAPAVDATTVVAEAGILLETLHHGCQG
ncbi:MAG: hypothetical protein NTW21_40670 [Verrucomicrobia bacterium]|nr:hypothetical protein [Verrucomicrobiota bacterium]